MSLIYALIARGDVVLAEYTDCKGNFAQITRQFLQQIQKDCAITYDYNSEFKFHFINENNITFLCLSESGMKIQTAFSFLEQIQSIFNKTYSEEQQQKAITLSLQSFQKTIQEKMKYYNDNKNDRLFMVQNEVNQTQQIMQDNFKEIMERQQKIDLLVQKTQDITVSSQNYKKQAQKVKKQAYWKNIRVKVFILILIIYLILVISCGGFDLGNC